MTEEPSAGGRARRRAPYWTLPAFLALMLAPGWVGTVALLAAVTVAVARPLLRRLRARKALEASLHRAGEPGTVHLGAGRRGLPVVLEPEQLAAHGLVLGASGAGKSTTLLRLLTERIRDGGPVVAVDLKGSPAFARALGDAARRGRAAAAGMEPRRPRRCGIRSPTATRPS